MSLIDKSILLGELNNACTYFERSTGSLTEEDSGFAPAGGAFTAANQVAHAAQTIDWFMQGAFDPNGFDMDFAAQDRRIRAVQSLSEARARLGRAVENARALLASRSAEEWAAPLPAGPIMGGLPRASVFNGITDHTAHHRGALTVYARLLGKTPPNPYL